MSVCRKDMAAFALMKSAPSLASAAEDMTARIICEMLRIAPLFWEIFFVAGHEHVAAGATVGLRFGEVKCIAVDCEDHVTGGVREYGLIL